MLRAAAGYRCVLRRVLSDCTTGAAESNAIQDYNIPSSRARTVACVRLWTPSLP